jgi:hypothetical protein
VRTERQNDFNGPTAERIIQSDGHIAIGDDQRGGKLYTFLDSSLDRIYSRLSKTNDRWMQDQLRVEYAALNRFYSVYVTAGLIGSIGSIDANGSGGSGRRSFLAATESQVNARNQYRAAQSALNHHENIVVQNVVCNDRSLEIAGYALGKNSKTRAIAYASEVLRNAGFELAKLWGLVR